MLTLAAAVSEEFEIRHSRFIAHAAPVADLAATLAFYQAVSDPDASHNCWAWRLDSGYRFNDDGEPASSAGKPILAAIEGKQLHRVMVVVTRHFGGIKLGVGGLIRAYGGSAAKCLDQGRLVEIHPTCLCRIQAGFEWTGPVHAVLEACAATRQAEAFNPQGLTLTVEVRLDRLRQLDTDLRNATRGSATCTRL